MKGAGGGKRGGRKPARVEQDDRPRGYEAMRMRQLWRDIDHAKHKAGLGAAPEPEPAAYGRDVFAWIDRAASLVGDAAAWVTAAAPAAWALVASGTDLLRAVPLVGRLMPQAPEHGAPPPAGTHVNGSVRPMVVDPDEPGSPDGRWVH